MFIHITVAEYLAAEFFINQLEQSTQSTKVLEIFVNNILYQCQYRGIVTFVNSYIVYTGIKCIHKQALQTVECPVLECVLEAAAANNSIGILNLMLRSNSKSDQFRISVLEAVSEVARADSVNVVKHLIKCYSLNPEPMFNLASCDS